MWVCVIAGQTSTGLVGGEQRGMKRTDFRGRIRWPVGAKHIDVTRAKTQERMRKQKRHNRKNTTKPEPRE